MTRIALLDDGDAGALAAALRAAGHDARVVRAPSVEVVDLLLARRGFTGPLSHAPLLAARLAAGGFDVAHAFTAVDAVAAQAWRALGGGRVVFTCRETLDRSSLADRRLRLWALRRAVERSDAVAAASEPARDALWRWMAVEAPVVPLDDARAQLRLYGI
ncbi:MAG TPA: glycosyltransferase [Solirubrobacteraceae bacterium]|nr:glycosyltransferase [Solirubrobacteraceae bacterium]